MSDSYDDILYTKYPLPSRRERMALKDRAKIFLPFAALKGYEEKIAEKQRIKEDRRILNNEQKLVLNETFVMFKEMLDHKEEVYVEVEYYSKDHYETIYGLLDKINMLDMYIKIVDEIIYFKDIYEIQEK